MSRFTRISSLLLAVAVLAVPTLRAQNADVPRTRTLPGVDNPSVPYAQPEEVGLSSEKLNRLGDDIVSWVADSVLVGAELLIVKDGKAVFHEAYGWSDREEGRPMRRNSVFWVGSMAKPVTGTAALILIDQGRLSLDDRVSEYIPEIPNDSLRVRHLLAHTSGYAYWRDEQEYGNELDAHASVESLINAYVANGPVRPFGEYTYSNFNYDALGYIVEKVTGVPLPTFTAEHVLDPLDLDDTYTNFSPDTSSWASRVNDLYQRDPETGEYEKIWDVSPEMDAPWNFYLPSGGLFSTAMDYARFMSMWMNKGRWNDVRLLSEATVEDALRPHTRRGPVRDPYGFGWFVLVSPEHPMVDGMPPAFHHGGTAGTSAIAFPSIDALVVYMTHSRGGPHRTRLENRLVELEIFDDPGPHLDAGLVPITEVDVLELTPEQKRQYVGTYRSDAPDEPREVLHEVCVEEGRLIFRLWSPRSEEGDLLMHLVPIGKNRFGIEGGAYPDRRLEAIQRGWEFRFIVEGGRARGFELLQGDRVRDSAQRVEGRSPTKCRP